MSGDSSEFVPTQVPGVFLTAFRQTLEQTTVGIALLDPPDQILYGNPALHGLAPAAAEAESLQDLLAAWARRRITEEAVPQACRSGHWHGEVALAGAEDASLMRLHLIAPCSPKDPEDSPWIAMVQPAGARDFPREGGLSPRRLSVPMARETRLLDPAEIHLLEADRHYTRIHTAEGPLLASQTLGRFQRRLVEQPFLRTHRSFLVNLDRIRSLWRDGGQCYLRIDSLPDRDIPVSRRRLARLEEELGLRPVPPAA
mgnify:CR=1 FL=1